MTDPVIESIQRHLELPAAPATVWRSLTDPALLAGWLADEARLDLRPGGPALFRIGDQTRTGWVEEVRPPEHLAFWWGDDGRPATRVQLELTPTDHGTTLLRLTESRPLEILDLVGIPAPGGTTRGPALIAA